ncbi:hypothetical protein BGZ65_006777 [Modicella reniformis]|uniref:Uncharacterized protein n=1 Tax=Modicella reniformis TaxID=1440133 RepID=A0A9P6IZ49_9FUNG|nr:hypothetical protein BGZ65_006777 [Modicella reniformis]
MVIFYFFTAILLLNVLIAIMNDAYTESATEGEISHWKLLSGVIAEVETYAMSEKARERGDYYPKHIYYCASEEEAMRFHSNFSITDVSKLYSDKSSFVVDTPKEEAASLRENQRIMNEEIAKLKELLVNQTRLIETLVRNTGLSTNNFDNDYQRQEAH